MEAKAGALFKAARLRAGFTTQGMFADALAEADLYHTEKTIGHWENDRRRPYTGSGRTDFLEIVRLLVQHGGFTHPEQVNALLIALERPPLSADEVADLFQALPPASDWDIPTLSPHDTLIGRDMEQIQLTDALTDPNGALMVAVVGLGGIGKSALLQEVLKALKPMGKYTRLASHSAKSTHWEGDKSVIRQQPTLNVPALMRHYLAQLVPGSAPTSPEALEAALRRALTDTPSLLVLDNLETVPDADQAVAALRRVLTGTPSRALLTSRERLTHTDGVFQLTLKGLSRPASDELIRAEAAHQELPDLVNADDDLLATIYAAVEGMPLALKLIVAEVKLGIPLDSELERLRQTSEVEEVYAFLYRSLWAKLTEVAQLVLVGAGTFAAPVLRSVLMQTCALDEASFNRAVPELVRASLLDTLNPLSAAQQRYALHAMTRWFVNGPLADAWRAAGDPTEL